MVRKKARKTHMIKKSTDGQGMAEDGDVSEAKSGSEANDGDVHDERAAADAQNREGGGGGGGGKGEGEFASAADIQGSEGSSVEACRNVPLLNPLLSQPPPPPPRSPLLPPPPPLLSTSSRPLGVLTKGLHSAFTTPTTMHNASRSYLPSPLYSAALPSMTSPALTSRTPPIPTSSSVSTPRGSSGEGPPASPAYDHYRDGGGVGGGSGSNSVVSALAQQQYRSAQSDAATTTAAAAAAAASLAYASRLQQEGFPYGLSGVPSMSGYGFGGGGELYGYVAGNGFPRKSRVCTYCSKVFTRSTTRRYHEKRCPLLRAAGSLMKGTSGSSSSSSPPPPPRPSSHNNDVDDGGGSLSHQGGPAPAAPGSMPPPHHITVKDDSPSPPIPPPPPPPSSSSFSTSEAPSSLSLSSNYATSMGLMSLVRPHHALNAASFYSLYGSPAMASTLSTSHAAALMAPSGAPAAPPSVDQNRNSVPPSVKKEVDREDGATAHSEDTVMDSDCPRDAKLACEGEEEEGGGGGRGDRQQPLFSPHSTTSRTPSDEDKGSEEGEPVSFKLPLGVNLTKPSTDLSEMHPLIKQYYLASLQAAQGLLPSSLPAPLPTANLTNSAEEKAAAVPAAIAEAKDVGDKEDGSFRDEDSKDSQCQDDEDTDHYSYSTPNRDPPESGDDSEENRRCGICKQEFSRDRDLVSHACVHQKFRPDCCRFCGEQFLSQSERLDHQRCHSVEHAFGCVVCGLHFLTKFAIRQHVRRKHCSEVAEDTACRFCQLTVDSVYDLRAHFYSHRHRLSVSEKRSLRYLPSPPPTGAESAGEEEASQDLPPPSIDSKTSQDSPEELNLEPLPGLGPTAPNSVAAPVVDEGSSSPSKMNGGAESGGSREKEWCRICQKEFPKSYMRYHEKEHANQKPYECPLCKKRFGYKNNMKSHMKLHAGIKPHQCHICLAKFTRGSTLRRHARRHGYIGGDNMWELMKKPGMHVRGRTRDMLLGQHASTPDPASLMAKTPTTPTSPPLAGARAMKADPALMASMGKTPDLGAASGKGYDVPGYTPPTPVPHNLFDAYRNLPPSMLQSYMTPQQYLGFSRFTPGPNLTPALAQEPQTQSDALDFSMPGRKRKRTDSSPSSTPVSQGPTFPASSSSASSRLSSAGGQPCPPVSSPLGGEEPGRSHSHGGDSRGGGGVGDSRTGGEKGERTGRSSVVQQHQYHPKHRASLCETVERLMESRTNRAAASKPPHHHHPSTPRSSLPDLTSSRNNASPRGALFPHDRDMPHQDRDASFRAEGVPDSDPPEAALASSSSSSKRLVGQDFSSQVTLCCPDEGSRGSSPLHGGRDQLLQQETVGSLVKAGRLFRCTHCDCYFTDCAMFRLHQKMHPPDHPFLCFICHCDCKDPTTFTGHMLSHLR